MPISTVFILKYVQRCYVKWFWTISSLGAPVFTLNLKSAISFQRSFGGKSSWARFCTCCACVSFAWEIVRDSPIVNLVSQTMNIKTPFTVRVKDGMSLRNGMWHGLRNDIIMRNVVYSEWPKEIDLSSPCFNVAGPTYDDNQKTTMAHCRLVFFAQPQRFFLPLLVGMNGRTYTTSRKSAIEEKIFWKVMLPFYKLREKSYFFRRWVTWSWHNIQRWIGSRNLFPWLRGLVFSTRSRTAGREGRVRILAIECVSFFLFFPSYRFSIFSLSNGHTHTNKEGAKTRGKAERRQRAVRFTRFLDYWLIFDSGCSFSLKYDRPPYWLIIPRIVASPTSRSTSASSVLTLNFDDIIMEGRKGESIVENTKDKLSIT